MAGLAPLTPPRVFTAWRFGPAVVPLALAGIGYLGGVRALRRRGHRWPAGRVVSFLAGGIGTLLVITCGVVGVYAGTLFWMRAVQHVALLMIAPMFAAMGAPLTLLREVLPAGPRARLGALLRGGAARVLTFPLVVTAVFVGSLPVLYLTPLYPASLADGWLAGLVGTGLFGAGWLYFWTRFRIDPTPRRDPYLLSLGISVAEVVLDGALGLAVWLGPLLAPAYYLALGRTWGPGPRLDQTLGAGVLWVVGDLAGMPFLGVMLRRLTNEDAAVAARVDLELDRQEQLDDATGHPRLWWEDHPELAQRFRRYG